MSCRETIKKYAKKTHKNGGVYIAYGFLDTLNLAPKMLELFYETTHDMKDHAAATADMYDWLRTPDGIIASTLSIIPLAGVSAFANYFFPSKIASEKAIYRIWQMIRDAVKGIKNAVRGVKSGISAIRLLTIQNFAYLLMPVGFLLGFISAGNRIWNRCMTNARKDMQDDNDAIIKALDEWGTYAELDQPLPDNGSTGLQKHLYCFRKTPDGLFYIRPDENNLATAVEIYSATAPTVPGSQNQLPPLLNFSREIERKGLTPSFKLSIEQWRELLDNHPCLNDLDEDEGLSYAKLERSLPGNTPVDLRNFYGLRQTPDGLFYVYPDADNNPLIERIYAAGAPQLATFLRQINSLEPHTKSQPNIEQWRELLLDNTLDREYADFHNGLIDRKNNNYQSDGLKIRSYISASYGGFIDGLYMFMGLLTITAMSAQILLTVAAVSIFFSATCILTRLHEERDYQRTLLITQQKATLALIEKDIKIKESRLEIGTTSLEIEAAKTAFRNEYDALHETLHISKLDIFFMSLRQALIAYTALVCSVSAVALVSLLLFSSPLPQIVALLTVALGIVFLIGATINAVIQTRQYQEDQEQHYQANIVAIETNQFSELKISSTPAYPVFCWSDAYRACFSSIMKAIKFIFLTFALADTGEVYDSHNPLVWLLLAPATIISALVWGGRSLAKNRKELFGNELAVKNITRPDPDLDSSRGSIVSNGFFSQLNRDMTTPSPALPEATNTGMP